jgi:hypothetical protein
MKALGYRVNSVDLDWVTRATAVSNSTIFGLIDQAVAKYVRAIGVSEPPPDRTA